MEIGILLKQDFSSYQQLNLSAQSLQGTPVHKPYRLYIAIIPGLGCNRAQDFFQTALLQFFPEQEAELYLLYAAGYLQVSL